MSVIAEAGQPSRNIVEFKSLGPEIQQLLRDAASARGFAYCPYSGFAVGAALLCTGPAQVYTGCNVENSSYGISICAERTALVKAVSEGRRPPAGGFASVAVVADLESRPGYFVSPCGACRQFLAEFGTGLAVYLARPDLDQVQVTSVGELLPFGFKF